MVPSSAGDVRRDEEFHLTFDGELPSVGNATRPLSAAKLSAIWGIRDSISPQLRQLWATHHRLRTAGTAAAPYGVVELSEPIVSEGYQFVALVRPTLRLMCELDVRLLVNHEIGSVVTRTGDLDNRIKPLFDGLRAPNGAQEFGQRGPAEQPCYCLLEDDALITKVAVEMARCLSSTLRIFAVG